MLCRTGCIPYATRMVSHLLQVAPKIYVSAYSQEVLPKDSHRQRTYRNALEFALNSFLVLPVFLFKIARDLRAGYQAAYFPVFHPWNLLLLLVCRWSGIRTVVTVHDGRLHPGEANPIEQWLIDQCVQQADKLIFLSRHVLLETQERLPIRGRSHIVPHGILSLSGLQVRDRSLPSRPAILFLGRVLEYKGVDLLIEAVRGLPPGCFRHLTVAGQGDCSVSWPFGDARFRRIDEWLSEEKMAQLLNEHDLLVLPYREASQSGIITLGIAAAIPMVCTRVGGLVEQLADDEAVWVESQSEALREGLSAILQDPGAYRRLHEKLLARHVAAGWREAAARLEAIIIGR